MKNQPNTAETLFEEFVEHIEVFVDDVASQVSYTLQQLLINWAYIMMAPNNGIVKQP